MTWIETLLFWLATVAALSGEPAPVPLQLNSYDPDQGGINCMEPCDQFGSGQTIQSWDWGSSAACPTPWRGLTVVIEDPRWAGKFMCRDSGGDITIRWDPRDGHYEIVVDLLDKRPVLLHVAPADWYLKDTGDGAFLEKRGKYEGQAKREPRQERGLKEEAT